MDENLNEIDFGDEKENEQQTEGIVITTPFLGNIIVPANILKVIGSSLDEFFEFISEDDFYNLTANELESYETRPEPMISIAGCLIQTYLAEMRRGIIRVGKVGYSKNGKPFNIGFPNSISFTPDSTGRGITVNANLFSSFVYICVQKAILSGFSEKLTEYIKQAGENAVIEQANTWVSIHFAQHIFLFPKGSDDETDYSGKSLMLSFKNMCWENGEECAKIDCKCEFINYANFNPELKDSPVRKFFGLGSKQLYECVIHVEITDFIMIGKIKQ